MNIRLMARALVVFCIAIFGNAAAHDIPADARINGFVRPSGTRLELLIRVPMLAMQEIDFPLRGPGYLEVSEADQALRHAAKLWLIDNLDVYENDVRLPAPVITAARVSLASDRSFVSYEQARRNLDQPRLADELDLYWNQQLLDVLLEYPISSDRSDFAIDPRFERFALTVQTVLRFLPPGGAVRAFEFHQDPGIVRLDPSWSQAALRFVDLGFWHILSGTDHLLFVLCLVIPFRRMRALILLVTSFTVAHSISLAAAAFGFVPDALWFPPLIETLIAATIVVMALENIIGSNLQRRWLIAFAFGLIHGFGFSFLLRQSFQFAGDHLVVALLAFNLGVEIGQIAVLLVLVPALSLLFRRVTGERIGIIILSALVTHTAWHWMTERWEALTQFPFPRLDAAFAAGAMRALIAGLVLAGAVLMVRRLIQRSSGAEPPADAAQRMADQRL